MELSAPLLFFLGLESETFLKLFETQMHMQTNMQQFWSLQRGFLPQFLQFFGVLSVFWPCTKIYTFIIQRRENGPSFDVKLQQRLLDVLFQSWRSLPLNTEIKKSQRL